jgi:hypothetical protein
MDYLGHTPSSSSSTNYIEDAKAYVLVAHQPKTATYVRRDIAVGDRDAWISGLWTSEIDGFIVYASSPDINVVFDESRSALLVKPLPGTYHVTFRGDYRCATSFSVALCNIVHPSPPVISTQVLVDSMGLRQIVFIETYIDCNGKNDVTVILKTKDETCDLYNYSFSMKQA